MTKLSVNVNKLATLRNSRGGNTPDIVEYSRHILEWGAQGLTVHPRPDARHIRRYDVVALAAVVREFNGAKKDPVEFNIEGYPSHDYLQLVFETQPDQATLVPDPPEALTSNAGWKVNEHRKLLTTVIGELHKHKIRASLFIDPATMTDDDYAALKEVGAERVELYTEQFADSFESPRLYGVLNGYRLCATRCLELGLEINAGHDLNQRNLGVLIKEIPEIAEVSIGHALISEALYQGLETTIGNYLRILGWRK